MDLLEESSMSRCKLVDSPIDPNIKFKPKEGKPFLDPSDTEERLAN